MFVHIRLEIRNYSDFLFSHYIGMVHIHDHLDYNTILQVQHYLYLVPMEQNMDLLDLDNKPLFLVLLQDDTRNLQDKYLCLLLNRTKLVQLVLLLVVQYMDYLMADMQVDKLSEK